MQQVSEDTSKTMPRPLKSPFKSSLVNIPRVMRSRIVKATKQKPTKPKKLNDVDLNNQPIARSGSGKVALGPWIGAFGNDVNSDDAVLYIDRAGSTHKELNVQQTPPVSEGSTEAAQRSPNAHRKGTILTTDVVEIPPDEKTKKLRSREMDFIHQKPIVANWGRSSCGKQAAKGRVSNRVGMINQPKKGV